MIYFAIVRAHWDGLGWRIIACTNKTRQEVQAMARVDPLAVAELSDFDLILETARRAMGFVPNSLCTMGRNPQLLLAFTFLANAVLGDPARAPAPWKTALFLWKSLRAVARARRGMTASRVSLELKQLVAHVTSQAAGCRYCQAHTAGGAARLGKGREKLDHVWEYETSPHFSDAERAALRLAAAAGVVPNAATEEHFDELRKHFSDAEIVELVSVIALFGYLNRWNDTLATELEDEPLSFATERLSARGWEAGKHSAA